MLQTFDKQPVSRAGFGSAVVFTRKAIAAALYRARENFGSSSPQMRTALDRSRANDRPWVGTVGEIEVYFSIGSPIHCTIYFKNYGKMPARNLRVFAEVVSHMKNQPAPNLCSEINADQAPITLFPGEEFFVEPYIDLLLVREIDIVDIHRGARRLWVHGRVEYESEDGHHHTSFRSIYAAHYGMLPDAKGSCIS